MTNMPQKIERLPTYIKGIDKEIEGGIPKGFVTLIRGVAGTMKSSVAFNILYNEARLKGKSSFYISLEQTFENFSMHLSNLGMDLSKINVALANIDTSKLDYINKVGKDAGTIIFLDVPYIRENLIKTRKMGEVITVMFLSKLIDKLQKSLRYDYLVLDSLNALYALSEIKKPREMLYNLIESLRSKGLTSYIIQEVTSGKDSEGVEDYLVDSVIFLDTARYDRVVQREILIKKMRATKSNINVFTLTFDKGQFTATEGGKAPVIEFTRR